MHSWELFENQLSRKGYEELKELYQFGKDIDDGILIIDPVPEPYPEPIPEPIPEVDPIPDYIEDGIWAYWSELSEDAKLVFSNKEDWYATDKLVKNGVVNWNEYEAALSPKGFS